MPVNFSSKNEPTKFYFDDSKKDEGWVEMRACPKNIVDDIEKQTVTHKKKLKRNVYVDDIKTDRDKQNELLWDYCITDWEGVLWDGEVLECTSKNKYMMMEESPQFLNFYSMCMEQLEDVQVSEGKKRKNLKKQSKGTPENSTAGSANA